MTIEGTSSGEADNDEIDAGEDVIDVAFYYGAEGPEEARLVRYVQLKHSTRQTHKPWTASGLRKTIKGFAERYEELVDRFPRDDVAQRFQFEFTTNRPISSRVEQALSDFTAEEASERTGQQQLLIRYTGLEAGPAAEFFRLFSVEGGERDLWSQRNFLCQDVCTYLPEADYDAPVQLKELVTRKATSEFEADPAIRRHDVLRALKVTEEQLKPAPCLISTASNTLRREQEEEVLDALLTSEAPVVIHADGGVGKSVLATHLAASMPSGSDAIVYDCFGDGLYRNPRDFRHRHRDAFVQIANELTGRGLCHPLIPSATADTKAYMRAFMGRLAQAVKVLRGTDQEACLCLIIDAADNAQMAAEERSESSSFARDLIRVELPDGVRLAFTCRTHRRELLHAPPKTHEIELQPFSDSESAQHLRTEYPSASDDDVAEFAFLTSSNPRVQALALSQELSLQEMLKQLGPQPTTVDSAIDELFEASVTRLRDKAGTVEADQIDMICQALAVLRPLIPVSTLAHLSGTSESAVRSFALDIDSPIHIKGNSLHFFDEPAETWFRERFEPDPAAMNSFIERIRPLTSQSSYAAAVLPQLLLQAGKLDELIDLALSDEELPTESPIEGRDVEMQRLTFALKACLEQGRHMAATKLALKVGGECAGEDRQNRLVRENTDLAATLMARERVDEFAARRTLSTGWMGSHHAYHAGLLSGREEFFPEASSRLRMALDWLSNWASLPEEERHIEDVTQSDVAELGMALLRLRGPKAAAEFLESWRPRRIGFDGGKRIAKRLVDLESYTQLDSLAKAAEDVWLLLGLAMEARAVGHPLPATPVARALRLLDDDEKLPELPSWNSRWTVLNAVRCTVEIALDVLPHELETWADVLRDYLPSTPPSDLASRFDSSRVPVGRAYALEASLRGQDLTLIDLAPPKIRQELEESNRHTRSARTRTFVREVGGLLPWLVLSTEVICNRTDRNLTEAIEEAVQETSSAQARDYRQDNRLPQVVAPEWLRILRDSDSLDGQHLREFSSWIAEHEEELWPGTLTSLCRIAGRAEGGESIALDFAVDAYQSLEASREDAESQANSYSKLARAIYPVGLSDSKVYFNRALEIVGRIGDENLQRWDALLHLAEAAGGRGSSRSQTAYRFSRAAELTYEYVVRDKHFKWNRTVEAISDLCASSSLAMLSRWRDRRFGNVFRLLPLVIYRLLEQDQLPAKTPVAFAGVEAHWARVEDLRRALAAEADSTRRKVTAETAYQYIRVLPSPDIEQWGELNEVSDTYGLNFPDLKRLIDVTADDESQTAQDRPEDGRARGEVERRVPDWDLIFQEVELTNSEALRSAYAQIYTYDPPYEFARFFREVFARVKVGREPEVIRAIADWPDFGVFKVPDLLNSLPSPLPDRASFRDAVQDAVLAACRRQPQHVQRRGWGAAIPFEELHRDGIVPDEDVVQATLEGFTTQLDTLATAEFFKLAGILASTLSREDADEALNFGLDLLEDVLCADDGDGPWHDKLKPPESIIASLAGYVWGGLGSPVAAERWEHAHVIRSIVELGWAEVLEAIIARAESDGSAPFSDNQLEFYVWHARQWLVIGLARGGLENAAALRPAVSFLQAQVRQEHVLIREFAAQALRTLVNAGVLSAEEVGDLDSVNRSSLPEEVFTDWSDAIEHEVPESEDTDEEEDNYQFGMDIGAYWFRPLGRVFGLSEESIKRRALSAIRERLGWDKSSRWREDARHAGGIFFEGELSHYRRTLPDTDDLSAYHAYHAMMMVAADLLNDRPIRRHDGEVTNEFRKWLTDHLLTRTDRKWIADRRDPRLVRDPPPPENHNHKEWCWRVTAEYLDQQLVTDDDLVVFWGEWSSSESDFKETVSVSSAFVSRTGAEALLATLQTAPELGRYRLPRSGDGEKWQEGALSLWGWVTEEHVSAGLDEKDPWAEGLRYPGSVPSEDVIETVGLTVSSGGRTWNVGSDGLIRSELWTRKEGYGREETTTSGERLSGNESFLKHLFEAYPDRCLILAVEVRRRPTYTRSVGSHDVENFRQPYVRYYLMEDDRVAHALQSST